MMRRRLAFAVLFVLALAARASAQATVVASVPQSLSVQGTCATWDVRSIPTFTITASGTYSGTVTWRSTSDALNASPTYYDQGLVVANATAATGSTISSATGQYSVGNLGITGFEACFTTRVSGTVSFTLARGIAQSLGAPGNVTLSAGAGLQALDSTGTAFTLVNGTAVPVSVQNGGRVDTDGTTVVHGQDAVARTIAELYGDDAATFIRLSAKAAALAATNLNGLVTRPYSACDGAGNCMPTGDASARTIHTTTDNASLAVTGTFWQATQPVSGTFWQATQPVSGTVTANQSTSLDPCLNTAPTTVAISNASATVLKLITKASAKKNYICSLVLVAGTAEIVNILEGTQTTTQCDTGTAAIAGSTTAANGMSLAANGGLVVPVKIPGIGTNVDTCLATSGANRVAGTLSYVQQ